MCNKTYVDTHLSEAGLLYEPLDSCYTKAEANANFEPLDSCYTKAEADGRFEPLDSCYTKAEANANFEPLDSCYTKAEGDAKCLAGYTSTGNVLMGGNNITGVGQLELNTAGSLSSTSTLTLVIALTGIKWLVQGIGLVKCVSTYVLFTKQYQSMACTMFLL